MGWSGGEKLVSSCLRKGTRAARERVGERQGEGQRAGGRGTGREKHGEVEGFLLLGHSGDKGGPEIANISQVGCPAVLFGPTPAGMVRLCHQELTLLSLKGLFPRFLPLPCQRPPRLPR